MAYTKNTNFTAKDALATGNPAKVIKGSEFDTEFDEIATESAKTAEKAANNTFSGNNEFPAAASGLTRGGSEVVVASDIGTSVQGYDADTPTVVVSQVDAEAGTATDNRTWTAQRVSQAIAALGAGATLAFKTISVSGQSDVVADSSTDTLTIVAGTNTTITTDAGTDTVTINSTSGGGKVLQRVEATPYTTNAVLSTNLPWDNTIPQSTEGTEVLTVAITPAATDNRLVIEAHLANVSCDTAVDHVSAALFQDATAAALTASSLYVSATDKTGEIVVRWEMAAGTTSSTTFKIRVGAHTQDCALNGTTAGRKFGGVSAARLSVTEID